MVEEDVRLVGVEGKNDAADAVYPMYFGASCAFFALQLLSGAKGPDLDAARRRHLAGTLLHGGGALLGLLVWRAQRGAEALEDDLRTAESQVAELKRIRAEDARANEKVVGIFAAHEQSWIAERKKLRLQIHALLAQFRVLDAKKDESIAECNSMVEEKERIIRAKEQALEEEVKKRVEAEEKLRAAEAAEEEERETAAKAAQDHAAELWKHKTAFAELVSSQRQLEAELGRALRQAEAARQELDEALEQKDAAAAAAEQLSEDVEKMRKDTEQKDKILSAMLRKSNLDTAEKQVLLKEVKMAKARRKQAELEVERLRSVWGPRQRKGSRGLHPLDAESSRTGRAGFHSRTLLVDYLEEESMTESDCVTPEGGDAVTGGGTLRRCSSKDDDEELVTIDIRHLQDWVRSQTEKYASILQQRHYAEVEAFTEQMRLKDEKLEAYRWRLLSMDLEAKRLQSLVDGLDGNLSQLREESIKLEAMVVDRERELERLKEQFSLHMQHCRRKNLDCSTRSYPFHHEALLSEVMMTKKRVIDKGQEMEIPSAEGSPKVESNAIDEVKLIQIESQVEREKESCEEQIGSELPILTASTPCSDQFEDDEGRCLKSEHETPVEEVEEEKEVAMDPGHAPPEAGLTGGGEAIEAEVSGPSSVCDNSSWKMDLHALGISYKIKRLKQQLLVLEKLAAVQALKQPPVKDAADRTPAANGGQNGEAGEHKQQLKGFLLVMSLLNKQVKRYQSLEEKTDDLCKRMHEIDREGRSRGLCQKRTREQTEALEGLLEETFQLQRYIVATGQKLTEIQSKIACTFGGGGGGGEGLKDLPEFNMGRFAAIVRTLFREIQRGLEVRIARIIGNLEGTLASDGILHRRSWNGYHREGKTS